MSGSSLPVASVSVVLPVRDGARYLAEAIDSVLDQLPTPGELIVVDDGSADDSARIAASYGQPVHVLRAAPQGIWPAINRGIAAATSPLLAFIDADDRWPPGRLADQLALLEQLPEVEVVAGKVASFHSPDLSAEQRRRLQTVPPLLDGYGTGAIVIRRAAFERVGPFDEEPRLNGLIDWWARARDVGLRVHHLDRVVLERRIHAANTTTLTEDLSTHYARALKRSLDRRRSAGDG